MLFQFISIRQSYFSLKELQLQMVGGEKVQDKELKAKRMKRKKYLEKRKKILSEALKNVDDEEGIMLKVYDDIHEELKAKTDLAKKQKQKVGTLKSYKKWTHFNSGLSHVRSNQWSKK